MLPQGNGPNSAWYPSAQELGTPDGIRRALQTTLERVYALQSQFQGATAKIVTVQQSATGQISVQGDTSSLTPAAIAKAISAVGPAPADPTGLVGRTRSGQYTFVPKFDNVPPVSDPSANSGDGVLVTVGDTTKQTAGFLWRYNQAFNEFERVQAIGVVLFGLHSDRVLVDPTTYEPGTLYYETDRQIFYIILPLTPNKWVYATGIMYGILPTDLVPGLDTGFLVFVAAAGILFRAFTDGGLINFGYIAGTQYGTQSNIPTPGAHDTGRQYYVTDYGHLLVWDGAAWTFGDGSTSGNRSIGGDQPFPNAYWVQDTGSPITILKPDGSLGSVNSIIKTTGDGVPFLRLGGTEVLSPTAATAPTWDAAAVTDDESTHTHSVAQTNLTTAAGAVPVDTGNPTGAGSAHHHALSNANAKLNKPNDTNGVWLSNQTLKVWVRI